LEGCGDDAVKSCTSATPDETMARLVLIYARNVRSDARWSRATLPEFSSRNPTHFHAWRDGLPVDGESRLILLSLLIARSKGDSDPVEKDRPSLIGDRERDRLLIEESSR